MKKLCSVLLILVLLVSCLSGLCFAADPECAYTPAGGETMEGTLKEAAAALTAKGGTIKLLRDVDYSAEKDNVDVIKVDSSITFDLNGHTITAPRVMSVSGKGVLGITHILDSVGGGAMVTRNISILILGGGLRMENVVCWSDTQQNVSFYDKTGLYNEENLITGCLLANGGWGAFSFNNSSGSQEKTCMTIENSTLVNIKGGHAIVRQQKAIAANVELGENVKLMDTKGSSATGVAGGILVKGMKPVKQEQTETLTILDKTFENLYVWKTGGEPAKPAPANPLDRVQPYAPATTADPKPEQQPYAPGEPSVEETPVSQPVQDIVTIPAGPSALEIVAVALAAVSVVLNLVILAVVLKKKKQ